MSLSPRPSPSARPATPAKKATSAPRVPPMATSSGPSTGEPWRTFSARSVAPASEEPPPRPAPAGISFLSWTRSPHLRPVLASNRRIARVTRFSSIGPTSAPSTLSSREEPSTASRVRASHRPTAWKRVSSRWKPSGVRSRIRRKRFTFAGASTVTLVPTAGANGASVTSPAPAPPLPPPPPRTSALPPERSRRPARTTARGSSRG